MLHELETGTHNARNSATDALLWLRRLAGHRTNAFISLSCGNCTHTHRAMEFIQVFLSEVANGETSLDVAAGKVI